ncbi:DUF192 domain-containing protein [Treponema sp. OttesenSCG-928-L16]|nr:DUF192 domain-containing protein [Treponema sp. OttesenSCG-928-L16]
MVSNERQRRRPARYIFSRGAPLLVFLLSFLVPAGASGTEEETGMIRREMCIERSSGSTLPVLVELAETEQERAQGLMYREYLADGEGMLFIFDRDQILSFWMKDTLIPLSIAFISFDGRILEIHDMEPKSLIPVYSTRSARYALEVPQGWFEREGIFPGDRIRLEL